MKNIFIMIVEINLFVTIIYFIRTPIFKTSRTSTDGWKRFKNICLYIDFNVNLYQSNVFAQSTSSFINQSRGFLESSLAEFEFSWIVLKSRLSVEKQSAMIVNMFFWDLNWGWTFGCLLDSIKHRKNNYRKQSIQYI